MKQNGILDRLIKQREIYIKGGLFPWSKIRLPPRSGACVDTKRRIVSFHPEDGFELLEFRDQALFFRCVDEYTRQQYRYQ